MGALAKSGLAIILWACVIVSPASAQSVQQWRPLIAEASLRFGVPEDWIVRVMQAESAGRTRLGGQPITSHAGAMGLMQIMPGTWAELRAALGLGSDPHDPRDNIMAGTAYLRAMYDKFGYPGLFAAYNAGPGRYARHLLDGRPLPAETRAYVAQIMGSKAQPVTAVAAVTPLAVSPPGSPSTSPSVAPPPMLFFSQRSDTQGATPELPQHTRDPLFLLVKSAPAKD